jgi:hypothetical protein
VLGTVVLLAGCGGGGGATTAQTAAEELAWGQRVEAFVAGLLPDLRHLERLTGGGGKAGAVGLRLDRGMFVEGPKRRQFEAAMTTLQACRAELAGAVPPAPTERLLPVRATLVQACTQLERVPALIGSEVLHARTPADVDHEVVVEAAGRADEGVRSVVSSLATLHRLLASPP